MKLKKLLAAVTAAALAVSTMAVTGFTASAEGAIVDSNVMDIGEDIATLGTNLGDVGWGGDIKFENLSEYATYAGKSCVKVDFTVSGDGGQFYVADCSNWGASATWQSKSGITYVVFTEDMASNGVMINGEAATINNVKLVHSTQFVKVATIGTNLGDVGWGGDVKIEDLSAYAAYAGKSYLKVDFTVSGDGGQFYVADGSNWGASATWQSKSGSIAVDFTSDMASNGVMINGEAATITNVDLYTAPVVESEAVYAVKVTPAAASVKVGETTTLTGVVQKTENGTTSDTDENVVWVSNNPAIATVSAGGVVTGVAKGIVEIRAYREGDDTTIAPPAGSYSVVTVTEEGGNDDDNTDRIYALLWEGNKAMPDDWSGNVQIDLTADILSKIKVGDKIVSTIVPSDGAQFSLKYKGENWPGLPGFAAANGGHDYTDPITATTYTHIVTAEDIEAMALGLVVSGHDYTLTKVELNPDKKPTENPPATDPDHTHTIATSWSSDASGHWHACSGCTEKFNFAAHISDGGTVTIPATETTAGTKTYKCTVCGYTIGTESIPATGTTPAPAPWVPHPDVAAPVIPTSGVNNSKVPSVNGQSGWEAVSAAIVTASDGDKIVVDMNSAAKVPSTILGDMEGKDVDVTFNMGRGIAWTVNGLSITDRTTINFDISKNTRHIPDETVEKAEGSHKKQISISHKGSFGCTAALTYELGTKYNGLYANLFYYNPKTEQLEFADCSLISGGKAKFMFTHASDYLITISDEPLGEFEDVSSAAGIASDNGVIGNGAAVSAVLAVIVLGFGIVVYRKRRHN